MGMSWCVHDFTIDVCVCVDTQSVRMDCSVGGTLPMVAEDNMIMRDLIYRPTLTRELKNLRRECS